MFSQDFQINHGVLAVGLTYSSDECLCFRDEIFLQLKSLNTSSTAMSSSLTFTPLLIPPADLPQPPQPHNNDNSTKK